MNRKLLGVYLICLALLAASYGLASGESSGGALRLGGEPRFPPVDKAFRLSASWDGDELSVRWYMLPGYYLYRDRLSFKATSGKTGPPRLPDGEKKEDPYFGNVEVYRDELLVDLPVIEGGDSVTIQVGYQGCADAGYCYPPQKRSLNVVKMH